jgi:hypothetical protein
MGHKLSPPFPLAANLITGIAGVSKEAER